MPAMCSFGLPSPRIVIRSAWFCGRRPYARGIIAPGAVLLEQKRQANWIMQPRTPALPARASLFSRLPLSSR